MQRLEQPEYGTLAVVFSLEWWKERDEGKPWARRVLDAGGPRWLGSRGKA
jgi:hypothetical protein